MSTTTTIRREAPFLEEFQRNLLQGAFDATKSPGTVTPREVAGLTALQTGAIGQTAAQMGIDPTTGALTGQPAFGGAFDVGRGTMAMGIPALQMAQQQYDPTSGRTQQFMNQYQSDVTQEALRQMDEQAAKASAQLAGQAVKGGTFGGARYGVQQAELAKPLYSEQEESSRRIDAALSGLASSNRGFQSGPSALAALNKVTDDIEKFRRENTEKSFQLGVGLIEKDMAAGQRAFDAGLEAQKTANGQLTAAMQTLSSRLTGADNIAFNRSLQQRQQEVAAITAQLEQLNKAEQLDVQERQLLVNIGRNTTTNLNSLRTMRKNLQDQFAIVADREDKTQADEIRQLMTVVDGQIAAEQSNLDFINSRFGLKVAPPPASGTTGGSPDLPAGFVED